ncbi:uncharacterized protein LOC115966371 [Quercus lobata]|uniref:uncharacterized protein LOC115966371 n=1 Tax=Quercus lobata TaxID=97700 RepID=UPI0012481450|nr:uncharacterized protein LOC115966371 [Quercus lobata]
MPGIDGRVIEHSLNINPMKKLVQKKRRVFAPKRNKAVMEEVEKLLTLGFIQEVYYPEWLANVVMVKKSNGKWRMCVDFTDLNNACPKDSFPLPRIDQLVDSTAIHELLTFMDAFSDPDQEAKYWMIYADGSFVAILGGFSVIMTLPEKDVIKYGVQLQFPAMNNEMEYEEILTNMRIAKALEIKNLKLRTDSKLIVGKITNEYKKRRRKNEEVP